MESLILLPLDRGLEWLIVCIRVVTLNNKYATFNRMYELHPVESHLALLNLHSEKIFIQKIQI